MVVGVVHVHYIAFHVLTDEDAEVIANLFARSLEMEYKMRVMGVSLDKELE